MKIIRNKYIPFKGFRAINLFGILFVRGNAKIDEVTLNHEAIHSIQIKEVMLAFAPIALCILIFINFWLGLVVGVGSYYILYVLEWIVKWIIYKDTHLAYRNTSHEREAYSNEKDFEYLGDRKLFAWIKYIR